MTDQTDRSADATHARRPVADEKRTTDPVSDLLQTAAGPGADEWTGDV